MGEKQETMRCIYKNEHGEGWEPIPTSKGDKDPQKETSKVIEWVKDLIQSMWDNIKQ